MVTPSYDSKEESVLQVQARLYGLESSKMLVSVLQTSAIPCPKSVGTIYLKIVSIESNIVTSYACVYKEHPVRLSRILIKQNKKLSLVEQIL